MENAIVRHRKNTMKEIILGICLMFLLQNMMAQNAWTRPKGNAYVQFGLHNISNYNSLFNKGESALGLERTMSDRTLQFYGEVGITDKLTLIANIPYKTVQSQEAIVPAPTLDSGTLSGLGNVEFGLRRQILTGEFNVAAQLNVQANTSEFNQALGLRTDIDAWSVLPSISVGRSTETSYTQAFIGYAWHGNDYSHHFRFGVEAGLNVFNKHWLIFFVDIYDALENGDRIEDPNNLLTGLFLNNQQFGGIGLKAIFSLPADIKLNLGVGGAIFGDLVASQGAVSIGIAREF